MSAMGSPNMQSAAMNHKGSAKKALARSRSFVSWYDGYWFLSIMASCRDVKCPNGVDESGIFANASECS